VRKMDAWDVGPGTTRRSCVSVLCGKRCRTTVSDPACRPGPTAVQPAAPPTVRVSATSPDGPARSANASIRTNPARHEIQLIEHRPKPTQVMRQLHHTDVHRECRTWNQSQVPSSLLTRAFVRHGPVTPRSTVDPGSDDTREGMPLPAHPYV
jgi:hypothetical protein